jgi:lysophospholipase L1-like esterase
MMVSVKVFFYRVMFWLMLPVSAIQGLRLKKTALRLPEASGEKSGSCGAGKDLHLLAIGDSIIVGVGTGTTRRSLPVQFATALTESLERTVHWQIAGQNGADILHLQQQIHDLDQSQQADIILISIGVNDVTGLTSKAQWTSRLESVTQLLKNKWPVATLIFIGLPPMGQFPLPPQPLRFTLGQRAETLDNITAAYIAQQRNMLHIPTHINPTQQEFCEDGFHPSALATKDWARHLAMKFTELQSHG